MNNLETLFNRPFAEAIGLTLMHSLWQGALFAIALAFGLFLLRKSASSTRYWLSISSLGLFFTLFCGTFGWEYNQAVARNAVITDMGNEPFFVLLAQNMGVAQGEVAGNNALLWFNELTFYFQAHAPLVLAAWLMGVVLLSLRLIGGYTLAQRMKTYKTRKVSARWEDKIEDIAKKVGLSRTVQFLESGIAKTPMVIGHLKPVVLMPLGILTSLSQHQVEAILAHELAHIRRNDYLVNLFQSVIEILFFYHPAIWWISGAIREERENACDDIAVSVSGDSLAFAKALSSLETRNMGAPQLAMAFLGKQGTLLNRIKRLVGKPQRRLQVPEGIIVLSLITLTLFSFAFQNKKTADVPDATQSGEISTEKLIDNEVISEWQPSAILIEEDTTKGKKKKDKNKDKKKNKDKDKSKFKGTATWGLGDDDIWVMPKLDSNQFLLAPTPLLGFVNPSFPTAFEISELAEIQELVEIPEILTPLVLDGNLIYFDNSNVKTPLVIGKNGLAIGNDITIANLDFPRTFQGDFPIMISVLDSPSVTTDSARVAIKEKYKKDMETYQKKLKEHQKKMAELNGKYKEEYKIYMEKYQAEIAEYAREMAEMQREQAKITRKEWEEKVSLWKEKGAEWEGKRDFWEEKAGLAEEMSREKGLRFERRDFFGKAENSRTFWDDFQETLIKDGLIKKDQNKVNVSIDGKEMKVGGKKVDDATHKKYFGMLKKYCKGTCSWEMDDDGKLWKFVIKN